MAETLIKTGTTKDELYQEFLVQIKHLVGNESNWVANLANVSAGLKEFFHFFLGRILLSGG